MLFVTLNLLQSGSSVDMCAWDNLGNTTVLKWLASKGSDAYWIGGPRYDWRNKSMFTWITGRRYVCKWLLEMAPDQGMICWIGCINESTLYYPIPNIKVSAINLPRFGLQVWQQLQEPGRRIRLLWDLDPAPHQPRGEHRLSHDGEPAPRIYRQYNIDRFISIIRTKSILISGTFQWTFLSVRCAVCRSVSLS